ncbi:MAG: hypothetical protein KME26_08590 [Oscillatoria princeps RMCB-10]|jgi:hypothetical protein|nr:hypothetical protein [Oscillatoria princeps RMCB-10]
MRRNRGKNNFSRWPALLGALAGGLVSTFSTAVQAEDTFGNSGLQFDTDTIVEFEFIESNGAFQSTFGVINLDTGEKTPLIVEVKPSDIVQDPNRPSDFIDDTNTGRQNDFVGTPGNAVPQPLAEFEFKAKTRYSFYLESTYNGRTAGILYSTDFQNLNRRQQTLFEGGMSGLSQGGTAIRWDDTGIVKALEERDFDDFIVRIGGHLECPYQGQTPCTPCYKLNEGSSNPVVPVPSNPSRQ